MSIYYTSLCSKMSTCITKMFQNEHIICMTNSFKISITLQKSKLETTKKIAYKFRPMNSFCAQVHSL